MRALSASVLRPIGLFSSCVSVFVKRDDLLEYEGFPGLHGNKARKLYCFMKSNEWDQALLSFGGSQSNSMNAISILASLKRIPFLYVTRSQPSSFPSSGNWDSSINRGMIPISVSPKEFQNIADLSTTSTAPTVSEFIAKYAPDSQLPPALQSQRIKFIKQGGSLSLAEEGVSILAEELIKETQQWPKRCSVIVPCGTGTTALYLAKNLLRMKCKTIQSIVPVPCVGGNQILVKQMKQLDACAFDNIQSNSFFQWLEDSEIPRHSFASLNAKDLAMWKTLREQAPDVPFDLIYAPRVWRAILQAKETLHKETVDLIYIHTGGTEGNQSQLERYEKQSASTSM